VDLYCGCGRGRGVGVAGWDPVRPPQIASNLSPTQANQPLCVDFPLSVLPIARKPSQPPQIANQPRISPSSTQPDPRKPPPKPHQPKTPATTTFPPRPSTAYTATVHRQPLTRKASRPCTCCLSLPARARARAREPRRPGQAFEKLVSRNSFRKTPPDPRRDPDRPSPALASTAQCQHTW